MGTLSLLLEMHVCSYSLHQPQPSALHPEQQQQHSQVSIKLIKKLYIKGIFRRFTWEVVLKQLNYPISILPILFRSVDHIVNDH